MSAADSERELREKSNNPILGAADDVLQPLDSIGADSIAADGPQPGQRYAMEETGTLTG